MVTGFLGDMVELALLAAAGYLALTVLARRMRPAWSAHLAERRLVVLVVLVLAMTAIKVSEEVLAHESGPIDEAILRALHGLVPAALVGFFQAVTASGSSKVLLPVAAVATFALAMTTRRREAWLLAASALTAPALVYLLKTAVGRVRPALWETQWYWGSSFPSGHTLTTAAVSTAAALCVGRIWPRWRDAAMAVALAWLFLVGLSRLVLGVHWPTDVLAAACIGILIPLAVDMGLRFRDRESGAGGPPAA